MNSISQEKGLEFLFNSKFRTTLVTIVGYRDRLPARWYETDNERTLISSSVPRRRVLVASLLLSFLFLFCFLSVLSRESYGTSYGLEDRVRFPTRAKNFPLYHSFWSPRTRMERSTLTLHRRSLCHITFGYYCIAIRGHCWINLIWGRSC
jgi:hypothetical protein